MGSLIDEIVRDGARRILAATLLAEVAGGHDERHRQSVVRDGARRRFPSAILPAWWRKSPKITEGSPLLYLHGLSLTVVPALVGFLSTGWACPRP